MTNRPPSGCGKVTDGWNVRRMVSSISLHFFAVDAARDFSEMRREIIFCHVLVAHILEQDVGVHIGGLLGDGQRHGQRLVENEKAEAECRAMTLEKLPAYRTRPSVSIDLMVGTSSPEKRSSP